MKRILLTTALILSAPCAYAWDAQTSGQGPQAIGQDGGQAQAQGQRQAQGQAQGQHQTATGGVANSKATGGKGGNVSIGSLGSGGNSGGLGLTVPGGYGNAPCGGGVGLGGLGLSGGGSGGGTLWEFGDCKRMRESQALLILSANLPEPLASRVRLASLTELCQIDRVREAFGGDCPTAVGAVIPVKRGDAYAFDYCYTASAGELKQHGECDPNRKIPASKMKLFTRENVSGGAN